MNRLNELERFFVTKKGFSKQTVRRNLGELKFFFRWLKEKELTTQTVEEFLYFLEKREVSPGTINSYLTALKHLQSFYKDRGVKVASFSKGFARRKMVRKEIYPLSPEELRRLLEVDLPYRSPVTNATLKALLTFMAFTGCRVGEAMNLKVGKLDLGNRQVTLQSKSEIIRKPYLPSLVIKRLAPLAEGKGVDDLVFPNSQGHYFGQATVWTDLCNRAKAVGITKPVFPHLLRHTFIVHLRQAGVSLTVIAAIVGHQNINTTAWYDHIASTEAEEALYCHPLVRAQLPVKAKAKIWIEKSRKLAESLGFDFVELLRMILKEKLWLSA